jgi:molecular chaperone DnaJ
MASLKDYYDILGIPRGATDEEIERAYRKLARAYQVDTYSGNRAAEIRFREIAEAYAVLSDKDRRARYDQAGFSSSGAESGGEYEWEEEICNFEGFEEFFEETFGEESPPGSLPQKGREIHRRQRIGFEKAVWGGELSLDMEEEVSCPECLGQGMDPRGPLEICRECGGAGSIQIGLHPETFIQRCRRCRGWGRVRRKTCFACRGTKRVTRRRQFALSVPPGISDGGRIYLKGQGEKGLNGGPNGDLVVNLEVEGHPYFTKRGEDLLLTVPLALWEAACGTRLQVPTLRGMIWVTVPPGVQNGEELSLAGKGAPSLHGEGLGNQILIFKVIVPRDLDQRSQELLRELRDNLKGGNPRAETGWPEK